MLSHCSDTRLEQWPSCLCRGRDNAQWVRHPVYYRMSRSLDNARRSCWAADYLQRLNGDHCPQAAQINQPSASSRPRATSCLIPPTRLWDSACILCLLLDCPPHLFTSSVEQEAQAFPLPLRLRGYSYVSLSVRMC